MFTLVAYNTQSLMFGASLPIIHVPNLELDTIGEAFVREAKGRDHTICGFWVVEPKLFKMMEDAKTLLFKKCVIQSFDGSVEAFKYAMYSINKIHDITIKDLYPLWTENNLDDFMWVRFWKSKNDFSSELDWVNYWMLEIEKINDRRKELEDEQKTLVTNIREMLFSPLVPIDSPPTQ